MAQQLPMDNPFLLMVSPEVVLAAVERSENLGRLNRTLCRPLDRGVLPSNGGSGRGEAASLENDDEGDSAD